MTQKLDIDKYVGFVDILTSNPSKDFEAYVASLRKLHDAGCDIPRLDTAITGMMAESGEAQELLKKLKFQGKEWTEDIKSHLATEFGDVLWYWIQGCLALGFHPDEIIAKNIKKLEARYPGGAFDAFHSENRREGDR